MNETIVNIVVTFLTALATGGVTSFFYWRKAKADLQKEYESRFNERKWQIYIKFVRWFSSLINSNEKPSAEQYTEFASDLLLVALIK